MIYFDYDGEYLRRHYLSSWSSEPARWTES